MAQGAIDGPDRREAKGARRFDLHQYRLDCRKAGADHSKQGFEACQKRYPCGQSLPIPDVDVRGHLDAVEGQSANPGQ